MLPCNDTLDNTAEEDRILTRDIAMSLYRVQDKGLQKPQKKRPRYECHSICRALSLVFKDKVVYVDGFFKVLNMNHSEYKDGAILTCEHSWLVTRNGSVIDPYPVGMFMWSPILFVNNGTFKRYVDGLYNPDSSVTRKKIDRDIWRKARVLASLIQPLH